MLAEMVVKPLVMKSRVVMETRKWTRLVSEKVLLLVVPRMEFPLSLFKGRYMSMTNQVVVLVSATMIQLLLKWFSW